MVLAMAGKKEIPWSRCVCVFITGEGESQKRCIRNSCYAVTL